MITENEIEALYRELTVDGGEYAHKVIGLLTPTLHGPTAMTAALHASLSIMIGVSKAQNIPPREMFSSWLSFALRAAQDYGISPQEIAETLGKLARTDPVSVVPRGN